MTVDSIELKVKRDVSLEEIAGWLSKLAELMETSDLIYVDIGTDDDADPEATPNGDAVSILLKIGPCPGRQGPPFTFELPEIADPPPAIKKLILDAQVLE